MENTNIKTSPKDFFLHVGAIVALYIVAISILSIVFTLADAAFPVAQYSYYYAPSISWPVASVIIFFPLFILLSWLLYRDYRTMPEKKNLSVRKWLVYITLFITGLVLAGDLVTVLYYFLDGQTLTTTFLIKVLSVLVVAGGIFVYYLVDLRDRTFTLHTRSAVIATVVVLAIIVWGFVVVGSPATQRARKIDEERISALQNIQSQVLNYWQQKGDIPEALASLDDAFSGFVVPQDPETAESYEYHKKDKTSFELCANFAMKNDAAGTDPYGYARPMGIVQNENWQHNAGRTCFERVIDKGLYPPRASVGKQ